MNIAPRIGRTLSDTGVRIAVSLGLDMLLVVVCATILWNNGGTTVADGSWVGNVLCFVVAAACLSARNVVVTVQRTVRPTMNPVRPEWIIAGVHVVLLAIAVLAWSIDADYYLGWLACFAALMLFISSIWQFLGALVNRPEARTTDARSRSLVATRVASLSAVRLVTLVVAVVAMVVLAPVHTWTSTIFDTLIALMCGAIFLGVVAAVWLGPGQVRAVVDESSPSSHAPSSHTP